MKPVADVGANVRVSVVAPNRKQCGISDYSRGLNAALQNVSGIEIVREVPFPDAAMAASTFASARAFAARRPLFQAVAREASSPPAQMVHIQHEFSLFDGAAPHKCQAQSTYRALRLPAVLTVHELLNENGSPIRRAVMRHSNRMNFLHPAIKRWIVHTSADRDKLAEIGAPIDRIDIIPVPVPYSHPLDLTEVPALKKRFSLDQKRVLTLFGFISRKKAHADAVAAMKHLPDDVVLVIAGGQHPQDSTDYVPSVRRLIADLGLDARVIVTGFLNEKEVDAVMSMSEAALAPFHSCSGSASVAHLLASGVPVIGSDIEPFAEICTDTPGAITLFPMGNVEALAASIRQILHNPEARRKAAAFGRQYARKHSPEAAAEATLSVYRKALASA
jgi:glycosyltransferase involved in cell wall biosynthesis